MQQMTVGQKQRRSTQMVVQLIKYAYDNGYELTLRDANRDLRVHGEVGEFWESLGGSWGGQFNDGNHYSIEHGRRK